MNDSLIMVAKGLDETLNQAGNVGSQQTATSFISSPIFTIVAFALGVVCLVLVFLLFLYCRKWRWTDKKIKGLIRDSLHNRSGNISQAVISLVLGDDDLKRHFSKSSQLNSTLSRSEIEAIVQFEVDKIMREIQSANDADSSNLETIKTAEESLLNPLVLYASTVNEGRNCFYEVTKTPKNDTIFVLEVNKEDTKEATFSVYDKVFKKVIQEQGHLKGGCAIENPEMNHTSVVNTVEPGLTQCVDGEWVIKQKAKVKFV